jgi:ribose transport system permease protein
MSVAQMDRPIAEPGKYATKENPLRGMLSHPLVRAFGALALVLVLGFVFNAQGAFRQWGTHRDMLRQLSVYGILACGMTLVIISGGIDLAVGSVLALGAVIFSKLCIHLQWSPAAGLATTAACGIAAGLLSGSLIARFRIQPFIATLAMMVFARGLAKRVTEGQMVSNYVAKPDGSFEQLPLPHVFDVLNSRVFNDQIAVVTLVFVVVLIVTWVLLSRLRWGRYVYAIGGNEEASRLSGVPTAGTKLMCYGLSGLFAAIAGICQAGQELQGDPEAGSGYELTAIAMVVIGGTSLAGGRGGVGLTLIGALTIGYLEKVLSINAVQESTRLMLTGAIIVGAVLFQRTRRN